MTLDELLTDGERAGLERVIRASIAGTADVEHDPAAEDRILREFGHAYTDARVSGLCREGALEAFHDAIRGRRPARS